MWTGVVFHRWGGVDSRRRQWQTCIWPVVRGAYSKHLGRVFLVFLVVLGGLAVLPAGRGVAGILLAVPGGLWVWRSRLAAVGRSVLELGPKKKENGCRFYIVYAWSNEVNPCPGFIILTYLSDGHTYLCGPCAFHAGPPVHARCFE
jgi:hypothetical protein